MRKPSIIILSDVNGKKNDEWIAFYIEPLMDFFEIQYLDCVELAGIEPEGLTDREIHQEFIENGINKAVEKLLELKTKKAFVLAFSIGGTIAWKAILKGYPATHLFAICSTRLRNEYQNPKCEIELYFGDSDEFRPADEWFDEMAVTPTIFQKYGHEMYKEETVAAKIKDDLINKTRN